MGVYINSLETIKKRLKINDNGPIQALLTETCYKAMDKYVPKDIGNLRTIVDLNTNSITYESEYASYQFYGKRKDNTHVVRNYSTNGTGPRWDKRMISADIDKVCDDIQKKIGGK